MVGKDERWEVTASAIGDSTANAHLIAAAPEMYEALQRALVELSAEWRDPEDTIATISNLLAGIEREK
jgi:hypothetical protein